MSWMPCFGFGFSNAWIPMLIVILHPLLMKLVDKAAGTGDINLKMGEAPLEAGQKRPFPTPALLQILLFIFSIFLPLKLGTMWLYVGLMIYLVGTVMFLNALVVAAKTSMGKVFSRGMYRYSRHPLYISFVFIFFGISVATASWLFLLLAMGWMLFPLSQVDAEEQQCLISLGSEYQDYVRITPKWLGIPKANPHA